MRRTMSSLLALGAGIGAMSMMRGNNVNMNRMMRRMNKRVKRAFR